MGYTFYNSRKIIPGEISGWKCRFYCLILVFEWFTFDFFRFLSGNNEN